MPDKPSQHHRHLRWPSMGDDPIRLIVRGYALYVLVGWLALCLPWCQQAEGVSFLEHLFTAVSAVSTTGLVTVSTSDTYSAVGEGIILLLIQLGGLGYMTISSFIVLTATGDLSKKRRGVSLSAVSAPEPWLLSRYLKLIVAYTAVVEVLGAAALYPSFAYSGAPHPLWQSVFHSVSAFCTAGFSLFSNSLEDYRGNIWLNLTVGVLSYLGAIGFIVVQDVWNAGRSEKRRLTLTSKIILWSTLWILVIGTILFGLGESSVHGLPMHQRWLTSLFQVMTASTTVGFNTTPIGGLESSSLVLLGVAMIVGASPSGTGGGVKTTTVAALWAQMVSVVRRRDRTTFAKREIPEVRLRSASAGATFYLLALAAGVFALSIVETSPLSEQAFECASALGTVGLSCGITGGLTTAGKCIVIVLMFLGRIGPIVLGMSLFTRKNIAWRYPDEDVVVG